MPEMRVMESRLAIVPTLPFCGLPNVNRVGDRESYAGIGSAVLHTPVHPAYALFGLPSIVTVPLASL